MLRTLKHASCFDLFKKSLGGALLILLTSSAALAVQTPTSASDASVHLLKDSTLLAQMDDAYDPFVDFSEFENNADEEADINFFINGRFFTIGFLLGARGFTQELSKLYSSAPAFGLSISYFFDLRFAMQVSFLTGDYGFHLRSPTANFDGTVGYTAVGLDLKYYFNTQNVTKGLADLNPYLIGGFSQVYRTTTINSIDKFAKDSTMGFDLGAGIEIPMMRNKMYLGLQGTYQYINFDDENSNFLDANDQPTGITPKGDSYTILTTLGVNF